MQKYEIMFIVKPDMEEADITHGDRWTQIYYYMEEHYPGATGSLITGLTYFCEA